MILDKIVTHFNSDLYIKVRKEREKVGYPVSSLNIDVPDSPLINKKIMDLDSGDIGYIQSVHRQYYNGGWYIAILVNYNGSHGLKFWENINCPDELMISLINETKNEYKIL